MFTKVLDTSSTSYKVQHGFHNDFYLVEQFTEINAIGLKPVKYGVKKKIEAAVIRSII